MPKRLTSVDDVNPTPQSTKDTPSNVDSISLGNAGPIPSLGHPNAPHPESPGKRTKPASSVAAAAQPPPLLLNVAEVDGEGDGEGSRSIGSMLKKLTVSVVPHAYLLHVTLSLWPVTSFMHTIVCCDLTQLPAHPDSESELPLIDM